MVPTISFLSYLKVCFQMSTNYFYISHCKSRFTRNFREGILQETENNLHERETCLYDNFI